MNRNRGQSRVPSFALILLLNELVRTATTYGIPTVTLVTIVSQVLIFLRIIPVFIKSINLNKTLINEKFSFRLESETFA